MRSTHEKAVGGRGHALRGGSAESRSKCGGREREAGCEEVREEEEGR